jgi:hypothetical protein
MDKEPIHITRHTTGPVTNNYSLLIYYILHTTYTAVYYNAYEFEIHISAVSIVSTIGNRAESRERRMQHSVNDIAS